MDLQRIKIFSDLNEKELNYVQKNSRSCVYPKGTTIFTTGQELDGLYIISTGRVKVIKLYRDGREKTLAILGAGEVLGETTLFGSKLRYSTVETLDHTTLFFISRENFKNLLITLPCLSYKIMELLTLRLRTANRQIEDLAFLDAHRRIVCNLIYLSEEHGLIIGKEIRLSFSITHSELAKLAAVSRETVTKVLKDLQRRKLISMIQGRINILNMDNLKKQIM